MKGDELKTPLDKLSYPAKIHEDFTPYRKSGLNLHFSQPQLKPSGGGNEREFPEGAHRKAPEDFFTPLGRLTHSQGKTS